MDEKEYKQILDRALAETRADETQAALGGGRRGYVRFGANEIRAIGSTDSLNLTITAAFGSRHGSSSTNDVTNSGVRRAAERATAAAKVAPEDPEWAGVLGAQKYIQTNCYDSATENVDPAKRANIANAAVQTARDRGLEAAGFVDSNDSTIAIATSRGLIAFERRTQATYTITMRTVATNAGDGIGSGWGSTNATAFGDLLTNQMTRRAAEHALASRDPQPIEPGNYTVVLDADAVADLLRSFTFSLGAREAHEGRSFAGVRGGAANATKIGQLLFPKNIHISTDPARMRAASFDGDGLPARKVNWVESGALKELYISRNYAKKSGGTPSPFPSAITMAGGKATIEELVSGVDRGIYVPRVHYIRSVDPSTVMITGMTRDGVRLIEKGKLTKPLKNLRWTQSVVEFLASIEALGEPRRLITYEAEDSPIEVPAVRAKGFRFTGVSDSV